MEAKATMAIANRGLAQGLMDAMHEPSHSAPDGRIHRVVHVRGGAPNAVTQSRQRSRPREASGRRAKDGGLLQ
jgi:hypothetical protein